MPHRRNVERLPTDPALRHRLGLNHCRALHDRFTVQRAYHTIVQRVSHPTSSATSASLSHL